MKALRCRKGAAAVEFAFVLPMLLLLVFGIIEFGLLMYNQQVITNASREGARAGIVQQSPRLALANIDPIVQNYCASHLITFAAGGATPVTTLGATGTCTAFGDDLQLTVTYAYKFLVVSNIISAFPAFLGSSSIPGTVTLTAKTVMRCE